jgi:hypothetical protein
MKQGSQYEQTLTNEELLKRFTNQFELVRYAIRLAENAIRSGREVDLDVDSKNLAFQILCEIVARKEQFQELTQPKIPNNGERGQMHHAFQKESKKERKTKTRATAKSLV